MFIYEIYESYCSYGPECTLIKDAASQEDWDQLVKEHEDYEPSPYWKKGDDKAIWCQVTDPDAYNPEMEYETNTFLFTDRVLDECGRDPEERYEELSKQISKQTSIDEVIFTVNDNEITCTLNHTIRTINGLDEILDETKELYEDYRLKICTMVYQGKPHYYFEANPLCIGSGHIPLFPRQKLMDKVKQFLRHQEYIPPEDIILRAIGEK